MDKTILKKFAIESRQDLMQKIENKIKFFFVDESFSKEQNGDIYVLFNDKHTLKLSKEEYEKRQLLIERINKLGLDQVIEEAAYTWFNRIVAIRYMEIHDYLPLTKENQSLGIRVLSDKDNTLNPEIMKYTNLVNPDLDINFNKEKYIELKDNNEKFKYILLLVCNKLRKLIPQVFGGVTDYIDILIPDNLLNESGFVNKIVTEVSEENYDQVEIIGWLYQYYNQTEKDRVMAAKKAYKKNEIAYATQLFTPDWIVKYMVENSLGRYYIENNSDIEDSIIDNWKYFIKDNIELQNKNIDVKEITFIDPCCGSGHILVYAFEVLYQMYLKSGYNKKDIPELILKHNLYGLDIDDRAGQLSILAVILKAREYDKNIFNKKIVKELNILSIQESNKISYSILDYINGDNSREEAKYLLDNFKNAKEIGSLLILEEKNYDKLLEEINNDITMFSIELKQKLLPLIKIAKILSKKYDVVVTNPPYLNTKAMCNNLKDYLKIYYNDSKTDLCTAFMEIKLLKKDSLLGMINQHSWMFLSSFEELRKKTINTKSLLNMIHLGTRAFEEIGGEVVQTTAFILKNNLKTEEGIYYKLTEFENAKLKEEKFLEIKNKKEPKYKFNFNQNNFNKIPGRSIAYWISQKYIDIFKKGKKLGEIIPIKQGIATADNNRFLRQWYEVDINKEKLNSDSKEEALSCKMKWYPYNKGGKSRKWYGNNDYVVNWENNGSEIKNYNRAVIRNPEFYFKKCISWSLISSGSIAFRYKPYGHLFDVSGMSYFPIDDNIYYLLALTNTKVIKEIMQFIAPTLSCQVGDIYKIPVIINNEKINTINDLVKENIELSKQEWDSFEISWNFKSNPLIDFIDSIPGLQDSNIQSIPTHIKITKNKYGEECFIADKFYINSKISDSYDKWERYTIKKFNELKQNEEELNKIFIDIYGLQDELTPEVEDKDITIRKADRERDVKSLISYAVGCMFGRYSLDEEGLIYAGGTFDENRYKTFKVDKDNIIPITDNAYFADDIVSRFRDFVEVVYGKETLNENLDFIAETLGKKGTETSEDTIRRYFLNDFYKDHIKMYKKKPIYWLFDSGKKNGFKALIYMHRYDENLVPKVRLDYLHRIQNTYDKLLSDVNYRLTTDLTVSDKKVMQNRQADLNAKLQEIKEYDEKIAHIANQRINIDLDDGVTENYAKFGDILAKIK